MGKEYFFKTHLIFCYLKREKITLIKEAIFPISQFYFLLLIVLLVRIPRDLCSTGGGSSAKTKHTQMSALSFTQVIPSEMPWPGKGRERQQGWLGGHSREAGTRSCCSVPAMHPSCQAPEDPSGEGCCRLKWSCFPLPLFPFCPVDVQVTGFSACYSDLDQNP